MLTFTVPQSSFWRTVNQTWPSSPFFFLRMSISWRSPCFLRECPCSILSLCLLPNLKRDWTYREYIVYVHASFFSAYNLCDSLITLSKFYSSACLVGWLRLWLRCPKRSWASMWKRWCLSYAVTTCQMKTWKCPMSDTPFAELHSEPPTGGWELQGGKTGWAF